MHSGFLGQLFTGLLHYIPMPRHVFITFQGACLATDFLDTTCFGNNCLFNQSEHTILVRPHGRGTNFLLDFTSRQFLFWSTFLSPSQLSTLSSLLVFSTPKFWGISSSALHTPSITGFSILEYSCDVYHWDLSAILDFHKRTPSKIQEPFFMPASFTTPNFLHDFACVRPVGICAI